MPWVVRDARGAPICTKEDDVVMDDGGAGGRVGGERKPTYSCGHRGKSRNCALPKPGEASCGERMKAGPVILVWKYEEGQSSEVLCIKIYTEP